MKVLVTGADGFVGLHLVRRLSAEGHRVAAASQSLAAGVDWRPEAIHPITLELTDDASVHRALAWHPDGIVHLAAVASGVTAREDPGGAWTVNAAGTARLVAAASDLRLRGEANPVVLVVSTGEVYGLGEGKPHAESDPLEPVSPYAASKLGAEVAALETWRRTGLRVVIVRPFPHTGPGQTARYAIAAFADRLREAKRSGSVRVMTGSLEPVRDLLDVRDVVDAYIRLLERGAPGECYNVARGEGIGLREIFDRLAELIGVRAEPVEDPALKRTADILHLVGDATKLRRATGWQPTISLEQTLRDLVDAQAD